MDQDADEKNKIEILNIFNDENLQNEASCETSINLYQGSTLKDFKNNNPKPRLYAEILDCNYSKDSNYGTFRLAIESLINHINKFNIDLFVIFIVQLFTNTQSIFFIVLFQKILNKQLLFLG